MSEVIVKTKLGQLKGVLSDNSNGDPVYYFLGIPYAKPPLGKLRFKAPEPVEPWDGVKDCTKEGSSCYCYNFLINQDAGSEDCLILNVFTQKLGDEKSAKKPVMVFIHGGGYTTGSSGLDMTGPKHLLNEDIVLVTINYRLGILGFLSLDDPSLDVPGNAGLKDQVMALKWVQDNISAFNGEPNNVTIFGVSAGGSSVHYLTLSPLAKGLFHKAIAQSGSAFNPWPWGLKNGVEVANLFRNGVKTEKEALEVLMGLPVSELHNKSTTLLYDNILNTSVKRQFGPVIEYPHPTAFLCEEPRNIILSKKFTDVPIIQGLTSNEGLVMEMVKAAFKVSTENPDNNVPWTLSIKKGTPEYEEVKRKVQAFYFKDGVTLEAQYKFIGDLLFIVGVVEGIKLTADRAKQPVYSYVLDWDVEAGAMIKALFGNKAPGVSHGADQLLLFSTPQSEKLRGDSAAASKLMVTLWTNFARTGVPSAAGVQWDPVPNSSQLKYLNIAEKTEMKINPFEDSVKFWDGIKNNLQKNKL